MTTPYTCIYRLSVFTAFVFAAHGGKAARKRREGRGAGRPGWWTVDTETRDGGYPRRPQRRRVATFSLGRGYEFRQVTLGRTEARRAYLREAHHPLNSHSALGLKSCWSSRRYLPGCDYGVPLGLRLGPGLRARARGSGRAACPAGVRRSPCARPAWRARR